LAEGNPDSYLYDPFEKNLGWWNLNAGGVSEIAGGVLKPVGEGNRTVPLLITSKTPGVGETVTAIARVQWAYGTQNGPAVSLLVSGYYMVIAYSAITDPLNPGTYLWVTTSGSITPGGYVYRQFLGLTGSGLFYSEFKMVLTSANIDFYLDGVLVWSQAVAVSLATPPQLRVSLGSVSMVAYYVTDFWLFGYNLPVTC
jgi:hypothetical protein